MPKESLQQEYNRKIAEDKARYRPTLSPYFIKSGGREALVTLLILVLVLGAFASALYFHLKPVS